MKTLLITVVANATTDLSTFQSIAATISGIDVTYITDIESAIDAINAQQYDLLIVDLDLDKADYKKIQKLNELIYPDAAVTEMELTYADYVRMKLHQMLAKWKDANSDGGIKIHDNPAF